MNEKAIGEWVLLKESSIHGKGIFASKDIPKGVKIIEYVGRKISKIEAEEIADRQFEKGEKGEGGHVYIFELDDKFDIDGNVDWNPAKWINHSCDPNCETEEDSGHIWIEAMRDIKEGEELSYDYCYDLEDYDAHPCRCGKGNCVGYIVGKRSWWDLKKRLGKFRT